MASVVDLDGFLEALGSRRRRLLELAEPSGRTNDDLVTELQELSQQLVVADEELRVQQEELEEARETVLALSAQHEVVDGQSVTARVLTDQEGVVVRSSRAAEELIGQPRVRLTPWPLASWFEVPDRRAVRSMISRAKLGGTPQPITARVTTPLGPQLVELTLEAVQVGGKQLLRWELTPQLGRPHAVLRHDGSVGAAAAPDLLLGLATAAEELDACSTRDDLLAVAADVAVRLVPGAQHADVVTDTGAALDPAAVPRTTAEFGAGLDGALSAPLLVGGRRLGVLTVHADRSRPLGRDAEPVLTALAKVVAVALHRLAEVAQLRQAVAARQLVGEAVGILVERRGITAEAAFAALVEWSQHRNVKLRTIARTLVETGQEPAPVRRS